MTNHPIICATELGTSGHELVDVAAELAKSENKSLLLVHSLDAAPVVIPDVVPFSMQPALESMRLQLEERRKRAEIDLSNEVLRCEQKGIQCDSKLMDGRPWSNIVALAKDTQPLVVVVGRRRVYPHRQGKVLRRLIGSTAERVVHKCSYPVLAWSREDKADSLKSACWLVGIDFSPASNEAFKLAHQFARGTSSRLEVIHVANLVDIDEEQIADYATNAWKQPLLEWTASQATEKLLKLTRGVSTVQACRVSHGSPSSVLITEARTAGAKVIVLGTHSRHGFSEHIIGTTTERVLRGTELSVLTVPEPKL